MADIMGTLEYTECTQCTKGWDLKYFLFHFYNTNTLRTFNSISLSLHDLVL